NSAVRWFLPEKLDGGLLPLTNVKVIYTNICTLLAVVRVSRDSAFGSRAFVRFSSAKAAVSRAFEFISFAFVGTSLGSKPVHRCTKGISHIP
ncbi:MAG TPA: hypothetical protein VHE78_06605, partial [Gemmatimonadaceae bacterium]|nr:hypothetical protein [Gemmatimonadaceae bacterium]